MPDMNVSHNLMPSLSIPESPLVRGFAAAAVAGSVFLLVRKLSQPNKFSKTQVAIDLLPIEKGALAYGVKTEIFYARVSKFWCTRVHVEVYIDVMVSK